MHPVHDIEVPSDILTFIPTVIEIPKGSHLKYEVDKPTGLLRLDRVLYSSVHYPANYGFIPRTHADDGDPLDVLVLMHEPVEPLTIVRARPLGGLRMVDDKGGDDKIVAVSTHDPWFCDYTDQAQLPAHVMKEIRRFFEDYKTLENKAVVIDELLGAKEAVAIIRESLDLYRRLRRGELQRK